ncbi:hypothetical protein JCM10908_001773 [Rhodotorula pacifica]|uniref:class II glutamine amidotransferase n=1 Tax=Rhodotorula pacifica TaxID=1495444 RepID=UPI003181F34D
MCRWIAYFSPQPILLGDVIERPKHSIIKQIDDHYLPQLQKHYARDRASDGGFSPNALTNVDGFGIGWYSSVGAQYRSLSAAEETHPAAPEWEPVVYRNTMPPLHDPNLTNLCGAIESPVVFGHVRAGSPVALTNCHPYTAGSFMLMHNGTIGGFFDALPKTLPLISTNARRIIKGTTDSEHFFALFLTFLDPDGDWTGAYHPDVIATALASAVRTIVRFCTPPGGWPSPSSDAGGMSTHISLNLALCHAGTSFFALRFACPEQQDPPSLYWSTESGATLDRRYEGHPDAGGLRDGKLPREEHGQHVVVASEPMTRGEDQAWHLLRNGDLLRAHAGEMSEKDGWKPDIRPLSSFEPKSFPEERADDKVPVSAVLRQ